MKNGNERTEKKERNKEREREREREERERGIKSRRGSIGGQIGKFLFAGAAELR